jgi:hypothetical protein
MRIRWLNLFGGAALAWGVLLAAAGPSSADPIRVAVFGDNSIDNYLNT